ncbi:hypothetical protein WICPIJ_002963 [Wickerhamomyces pijperi]|uniref:ARID domain-containing protein n=1 Tax=Wickerhamomyces pijperi TaxID=599730 RepID=A0A9P8TPB7_WICPI|nr:hypothetical protein WICPIJ_002963 [Wickerhamomyces pijperi]
MAPIEHLYSKQSHLKVDLKNLQEFTATDVSAFFNTKSIPSYDLKKHNADDIQSIPDIYDLIEVIPQEILDLQVGALKISSDMEQYKNRKSQNEVIKFDRDSGFLFDCVAQETIIKNSSMGALEEDEGEGLENNESTETTQSSQQEQSEKVDTEEAQFYRDISAYFKYLNKDLDDISLTSAGKKIDLYELRKTVNALGGFDMVSAKKLWDDIGKDLGLKGKVVKRLYFEVLLQFANWLYLNEDDEDEQESSEVINASNKRAKVSSTEESRKKQKVAKVQNYSIRYQPNIPIITHSKPRYIRHRQELEFKGFGTNFETFYPEENDPSLSDSANERNNEKLRHMRWDWQGSDDGVLDRVYSKDEIFAFDQTLDQLSRDQATLEETARFIQAGFRDASDQRIAVSHCLPSILYKPGFKLGSEHPWNLNNIGMNKKGLFSHLTSKQALTMTKFHINEKFGVSNWQLQDHMTYAVDYLHSAAQPDGQKVGKLWLFIAPKDRQKYEDLLRELSGINPTPPESQISPDLNKELSEMVTQKPDANDVIEAIISKPFLTESTSFHTDVHIPLSVLVKRGITLHHCVQYPGEYVLLAPQTYAFSISMGLTVSESVNFATIRWLGSTSEEGERYMTSHNILPAFSDFELLLNIADAAKMGTEGLQLIPTLQLIKPAIDSLMSREREVQRFVSRNPATLKIGHGKDEMKIRMNVLNNPPDDDVCDMSLRTCGMSSIVFRKDVKSGEEPADLITDAATLMQFLDSEKVTLNLTGYKIFLSQDTATFTHWEHLFGHLPKIVRWGEMFKQFLTSSDPRDDLSSTVILKDLYKDDLSNLSPPLLEYQILTKLSASLNFSIHPCSSSDSSSSSSTPYSPSRNSSSSNYSSVTSELRKFRVSAQKILNLQYPYTKRPTYSQLKSLLFQSMNVPQSMTFESQQLHNLVPDIKEFDERARKFIEDKKNLQNDKDTLRKLYKEGEKLPVQLEVMRYIKRDLDKFDWRQKCSYKNTASLEDFIDMYQLGCQVLTEEDSYLLKKLWDRKIEPGVRLSNDIERALMTNTSNLKDLDLLKEKSKNERIRVRRGLMENLESLRLFYLSKNKPKSAK